jgi:hypothetical protein
VAETEHPTVNFSNFIVSLASSAMHHLGDAPDPVSRGQNVDLGLARHTIDVLGLLREKTKGNLDTEEERLIETLLFDLRTRYVEIVKSQQGK